jgi:transcriptional regulator with XRE-family HTH domain
MYAFVPNPSSTIASRLKAERVRVNLSRQRVAAECCVPVRTVQRWERQGGIPAEALLVCIGLRFDVEFVLTGKRSPWNTSLADDALDDARSALLEALGPTDEGFLIMRGCRAVIH